MVNYRNVWGFGNVKAEIEKRFKHVNLKTRMSEIIVAPRWCKYIIFIKKDYKYIWTSKRENKNVRCRASCTNI